ncbi:MAG: hypothetical protein AMXMBFR8_14480 [Nevskiales bacterium]
MARSLVIVAATGIAASIICLSLASALSPYRGFSFPFSSGTPYQPGWWSLRPWAGQTPFVESGEIVTREFAWNGGESAEIYIPGVVYYESGPEWRVSVKGQASSVEHLRIDQGAILFDAPPAYPRTSSLEVRIRGPSLEAIGLNGSGKLVLQNVSQREISIDIRGSGSVEGGGTVERMGLRIFGSGSARLGELTTRDLDASIFGSGDADVAPNGDVEVSIFGSGDVRLHRQPEHVSSKVFGSGRVIQLEPGPDKSPVAAPREAVRPEQRP